MVEGVLCSFGAKMKTNLDRYSKVYLVHCLEFCSSNNEKEKSRKSKFHVLVLAMEETRS